MKSELKCSYCFVTTQQKFYNELTSNRDHAQPFMCLYMRQCIQEWTK